MLCFKYIMKIFKVGVIGFEPTASCSQSSNTTPKSLFYSTLYVHFLSIYRKYTGSRHSTHWGYTGDPLLDTARLPLGRGLSEVDRPSKLSLAWRMVTCSRIRLCYNKLYEGVPYTGRHQHTAN